MESVEDKRGVDRIGEINRNLAERGEPLMREPKRASERNRINTMLADSEERLDNIIIRNLLVPAGWPEIVANVCEGIEDDDDGCEDLLLDLKRRCDDDMIPCPSVMQLVKMRPTLLHQVA